MKSLPKYDKNIKQTTGILVTDEGAIYRWTSGDAAPAFANYKMVAPHVGGTSAIQIGINRSTGGIVFHNYTDGTCGFCNNMTPTLLPQGASLTTIPAASDWNAARRLGYYNYTVIRAGNRKLPKLNAEFGPSLA